MTTRERNIETIRRVCIAANPEISTRYLDGDGDGSVVGVEDDIRLADVLLALRTKSVGLRNERRLTEYVPSDGGWNFRTDDLTQQSDETLAFLAKLLTDTSKKI